MLNKIVLKRLNAVFVFVGLMSFFSLFVIASIVESGTLTFWEYGLASIASLILFCVSIGLYNLFNDHTNYRVYFTKKLSVVPRVNETVLFGRYEGKCIYKDSFIVLVRKEYVIK